MTETTARTVANALLATAGIAAVYVVVTRRPLRRLAVGAARGWLGASIPGYLLQQTRRAWVESGQSA
jgi:hypothetical protein